MKKTTIIALLMSLALVGMKNHDLNGAPSVVGFETTTNEMIHAINDTIRTKSAKIKVKANPSMIAKVQLLSVESLEGEVLYEKFAADNISTTIRFKVTPDTKRVKIKYGGKAAEIELENGVGVFDFMKNLRDRE